MSTLTKNYGLVKPELTDTSDITATNQNWDTIDEKLHNAYGLIQKLYDIETDAELTAAIDDLWSNTDDWSEGHFAFNMRVSVGQIYGGIWHITAYKANSSYGVIKVVGYNASHPTVMYLNKMQTWGNWEWVNPPMQLGVEYRTTERWHGKPVYTALIDCGAGPNGTFKNVAHGLQMSRAIRCVGQLSNGDSWPLTSYEGKHSDIYASIWNICAWSDSDSSNYTLVAQIWYVKD